MRDLSLQVGKEVATRLRDHGTSVEIPQPKQPNISAGELGNQMPAHPLLAKNPRAGMSDKKVSAYVPTAENAKTGESLQNILAKTLGNTLQAQQQSAPTPSPAATS